MTKPGKSVPLEGAASWSGLRQRGRSPPPAAAVFSSPGDGLREQQRAPGAGDPDRPEVHQLVAAEADQRPNHDVHEHGGQPGAELPAQRGADQLALLPPLRHPGGPPATSIHVYSPALWRMGHYQYDVDGIMGRVSMTYADELAEAAG